MNRHLVLDVFCGVHIRTFGWPIHKLHVLVLQEIPSGLGWVCVYVRVWVGGWVVVCVAGGGGGGGGGGLLPRQTCSGKWLLLRKSAHLLVLGFLVPFSITSSLLLPKWNTAHAMPDGQTLPSVPCTHISICPSAPSRLAGIVSRSKKTVGAEGRFNHGTHSQGNSVPNSTQTTFTSWGHMLRNYNQYNPLCCLKMK